MNYNRSNKNNSTTGIRLMCAIVFVLFSFCWLFFFQPNLLIMAQHVLSGGLTHYNRWVGAILITLALMLLQMAVYSLTKLNRRAYSLTYGPSLLLLGLLTDVTQDGGGDISYASSWWLVLILLIIWLLYVFVARLLQQVEDADEAHIFSSTMWHNMLTLALLMMCTAWIGNTNAVFHYRLKIEQCLLDGDVEGALKTGRKSLESDEHLLMLRMHALARQGALGEHLFEYPITGNTSQMLPTDSLSHLTMYPTDSLYKFIGARPVGRMAPMRYLQLVERKDSVYHQVVSDYQLCGYLIDRQIDTFAKEISRYYTINDSLPKHYREALTLYTHLRSHPVVVYHNSVMDEDYENLTQLERQYPHSTERKVKVEEHYRGTYWYYYRYDK